ncbi:MAG: transposase [Ignavibacteria bacterium]|nr:transposase [Ignavibacteria bacterium]
MTLFNKKYRVDSARLKGWDYSNTGLYYITICTHGMKKFFGEIVKGSVTLSDAGKIVEEEWLNNVVVRENVILDEYVVMPNHFHGIIALEKISDQSCPETNSGEFETGRDHLETTQLHRQSCRVVSTGASKTLKPNSIGSIIGQFKSKCTKRIAVFKSSFRWQGRFHDRVIRSEKELDNIRAYIHYNPQKWSKDEFYID